jgi:aspartyl protease family protein
VILRFLQSLLLLTTAAAGAAEVAVVGIFPPSKAVLVVDGRGPYTVPVGGSIEGVRVRAVDERGATLEVDGRTTLVALGAAPLRTPSSAPPRVVLPADGRGHHLADGEVNGARVRFLVDTGATAVAIPTALARRIGLDLAQAPRVRVSTANGTTIAWRVRLDTVSLGPMTMHQVDALVQDGIGEVALLGMSFLSRTDMVREGDRLVLTKRF